MSDSPRRSSRAVVLIVVGAVLLVGGAIGAVVAKVADDRAERAASGPNSLTVGSYGGFNFKFTHSIHVDYTSLWIAVVVAAIGVIVLVVGLIVAARASRSAGIIPD